MALRSIWKGAISFGLVHIPVALYPASQDSGIDWIDKRSMDPVGYKRINKRTGREIDAKLKDSELKMARQLVSGMTMPWKPEAYSDQFADAIHALIAQRVKAGKTTPVQVLEEAPSEGAAPSNVVDLTELLKRSLARPKRATRTAKAATR